MVNMPQQDACVEQKSVFADHLARLRTVADLTQKELALAAGIGHSTVASWELGRRTPKNPAIVEKLREPLNAGPGEMDRLYRSAGLHVPPRGFANRIEGERLRLDETASWLARYPWVCLIQNERHELLAWNRPADLVAEIDLATVLPLPEDRNILWMAVLEHFRDVRLTNWDELIGGLISVMKLGVPDLNENPPLWMQHLIGKVVAQYPEVLGRLFGLWQSVPTWRDGARNLHPVEWMADSGQRLEFVMVSRSWSLHDGTFAMDWHPMDSVTWDWLESQPQTGPGSTVYVEPRLPWNEQFEASRKALGLTRPDAAKLSGLSDATIYALERGKRRPSRDVALRLARALTMPVAALNGVLEQLGHPTEPSDLACWIMGEPRTVPYTNPSTTPRPAGESEDLIQQEADGFAWPTIVLNESCEVFVANPAAKRILDDPRWQPRAGGQGPHLMDVLLSDAFRLRSPNWGQVVRDILPAQLVPLVLGNYDRTKPPLKQTLQRVKRHSRATFAEFTRVMDGFEQELRPRVTTTLEWEAPDGALLRFHVVTDLWNSSDPYWAIDMHPADAATWRWFGR